MAVAPQELVVRNLSPNPMRLSMFSERTKEPPRGLFGGRPGGRPSFYLDDGTPADSKGITTVGADQAMIIRTHGGGGYGPPGERAWESLRADLVDGLRNSGGGEDRIRRRGGGRTGTAGRRRASRSPNPGSQVHAAQSTGDKRHRHDERQAEAPSGRNGRVDGADLYRAGGIGRRVGVRVQTRHIGGRSHPGLHRYRTRRCLPS